MKAVDTNILARLALADDDRQYRVAARILREPVWVSLTVWLELGWVLGSKLGMDRGVIADAMLSILLADSVHTADPAAIRWAIDRFRAGADWADVLHLVAAGNVAAAFVTFDRKFAREAGDSAPIPIETLA